VNSTAVAVSLTTGVIQSAGKHRPTTGPSVIVGPRNKRINKDVSRQGAGLERSKSETTP